MPVEIQPEAGALWFDNWILDATVSSYTGQQALYPATNLLSPHRSETWRSTATTPDQQVVFDLGSAKLPTGFALMDINFDEGATVVLRGADNSAMSGGGRWDFPLYEQDPTGKVLRWYLGDVTSGVEAAYQFWAVLIPTATASDPYEIGGVFLGEYTDITPDQGVRISPRDPSDRQRAYGRAQWTDPIRVYHEIDLTVADMTFAEFYALKKKIASQGSRHAILDVHAYSTDDVVKAGGCFYGYFSDDPASGRLDAPDVNELAISFEEASG